jgi:hypothetical protein
MKNHTDRFQAEYELKLDAITSDFWNESTADRRVSILRDWDFIIQHIEKIILAQKSNLLPKTAEPHDQDINAPEKKLWILEKNLHQLNSILSDQFYFNYNKRHFVDNRILRRQDDELFSRRKKIVESAIVGIDGDIEKLIHVLLRRYYTTEDLTVNKLIIDICNIPTEENIIWKEWFDKFQSIFPHGANFLIEREAMMALVGSKRKIQILTLLFSIDVWHDIHDPRKDLSKAEGDLASSSNIFTTLAALADMHYHPLSRDAFICWIRLKCLHQNFHTKCEETSDSWNFNPDSYTARETLRYAAYYDSNFRYFLLYVPKPDRADLKREIASNFLLFNLIGNDQLENRSFIRKADTLAKYKEKFRVDGKDCDYGLIMHFIDWHGSDRQWNQFIADGVIDQNYICDAPFPIYWLMKMFTMLDYDSTDIESPFFTRQLFWRDRPVNWN